MWKISIEKDGKVISEQEYQDHEVKADQSGVACRFALTLPVEQGHSSILFKWNGKKEDLPLPLQGMFL